MRKYRAWHLTDKKYYDVEGFFFYEKVYIRDYYEIGWHTVGWNAVILEESTEIGDKNNVEIYVGDIVKVYESARYFEFTGVVEYKSGCFYIGKYTMEHMQSAYLEVVGVVHKDGDLL